MTRTIHRLKPLNLSRKLDPGYHSDGGGLYLQVTDAGAKSWIFRYSLAKKRREMGLGPFSAKTDTGSEKAVVSLQEARQRAAEARSLVKTGQDPINVRDARLAQERMEAARLVTWDQAVEQFLDGHEGTWKNEKHRQQWRNSLQTYASPVLGTLAVAAIDTPEVIKVLDPIWQEKPETASRVRGRIERILDWSKVRSYRTGENPARWRGHLAQHYPGRNKVRRVKHHAAVPIDDMAAVYAKLTQSEGMAARALRFTILTAVRAGETTGAKWSEIDLDEGIWTIPASRMKMDREHRVPLSREALAILRGVAELRTSDWVFPGQRRGRPLSIASLSKALRVAGGGSATTHGFRSTFKDWTSERTSFPSEVSEMALAHAIGDKVEAAYRRGELMKKRTALMQQWATFASTPKSGKVVSFGGRRKAS